MAQRWFSKFAGNLEGEIGHEQTQRNNNERTTTASNDNNLTNYGTQEETPAPPQQEAPSATPSETTPLFSSDSSQTPNMPAVASQQASTEGSLFKSPVAFPKRDNDYNYSDSSEDDEDEVEALLTMEEKAARFDRQSLMTERLSVRLLDVPDDDSDQEEEILREELDLSRHAFGDDKDYEDTERHTNNNTKRKSRGSFTGIDMVNQEQQLGFKTATATTRRHFNLCALVSLALAVIALVTTLLILGAKYVGPPKQPIGPYKLVERQEGDDFFKYYNFYEGRDSVGSNGYLTYVSKEKALEEKILNVTYETDQEDVYALEEIEHEKEQQQEQKQQQDDETTLFELKQEPFVYMGSSPTPEGPRNSIRLEGKRRFNRGLFILDVRHMPAGCGVWPAFWLTDEANWPVNGEIDIVEGVNFQDTAKVALHSTKTCTMNDIPVGVSTGTWDTAQGIPDKKTGIPDMTLRYATNCFVYDPHQWLNQGCVAVDLEGNSLGIPVNQQGGGIYVLEWDPINRHIRSWVFSPHTKVPSNIRDAIRTASEEDVSKRVVPDPNLWPLPYAYYAIGEGTDCPSSHFRNMRLVFNLAFCGSVAGNRFWLDCKNESKKFKTCNDWIKSNPKELEEAYWKVRGVYVYERDWEKAWL